MKKFLFLSLGLVLVAASCNTGGGSNKVDNIKNNTNQNNSDVIDLGGSSPEFKGPKITISALGFFPATLQVKKGTSVQFLNGDTKSRWPASDPHPTHTNLPGFDAKKGLEPGETWVYVFDKAGTWGYHDHMNPSRRGSVTVTE